MATQKPATIDDYINGFEGETKNYLEQLRDLIRKTVPKAEETISYAIPCYKLDGRYLVYFAGYKHHIGIYPVPTEDQSIKEEVAGYKTSGKGTLQIPLDKPLPQKLLTRIIKLMVKKLEVKYGKQKSGIAN